MTMHDRLFRNLIGFDDRLLNQSNTYPPYNVIQYKDTDNRYAIEMAISGFSKSDIEITLENRKLQISGKKSDEDEDKIFMHKGIGKRAFTQEFYLAEYMEVKDASFEDGILSIELEKMIPEEKKPKLIEVK